MQRDLGAQAVGPGADGVEGGIADGRTPNRVPCGTCCSEMVTGSRHARDRLRRSGAGTIHAAANVKWACSTSRLAAQGGRDAAAGSPVLVSWLARGQPLRCSSEVLTAPQTPAPARCAGEGVCRGRAGRSLDAAGRGGFGPNPDRHGGQQWGPRGNCSSSTNRKTSMKPTLGRPTD
jgi:hypothetical protein